MQRPTTSHDVITLRVCVFTAALSCALFVPICGGNVLARTDTEALSTHSHIAAAYWHMYIASLQMR